jgi:hypothetical protein
LPLPRKFILILILALILAACGGGGGQATPAASGQQAFGKEPCTSSDGTYLGKPVEKISNVGDNAVWSSEVQTVCVNKGNRRVQISFGVPVPQGADPKTVATDLARKAVMRLP